MKSTIIFSNILISILAGSVGYFVSSFFSHSDISSEINLSGSLVSTGSTDYNGMSEYPVIIPRIYTDIVYNPIWQSPTQSGMYHKLKEDNMREFSINDLYTLQILTNCIVDDSMQSGCKALEPNVGYRYPPTVHEPRPSVVNAETEELVVSFFANPILLESSQSCAKYFWKDSRDGMQYYPQEDMGEPAGWWNPYIIDINEFMKINPESRQKEIEPALLWTFNTQIQFAPLKPDQRSHYPNMKLIECLDKNNLLKPLQKHVGEHYEKIHNILFNEKL